MPTSPLRSTLIAALGVAIGGCCLPAGAPADAPAPPARARLGDVVAVAGWDWTVHAIEDPYTPSGGPRSDDLLAGRTRYVAIDMSLRNARGDASAKFTYGWFHVYDTEGHTWESHYADNSVREPHLVEGYAEPGDLARGWVSFELPVGAHLDRMQFFDGYLDGHPASVSLR